MKRSSRVKVCSGCGRQFHPFQGREKTSKFCSKTCTYNSDSWSVRHKRDPKDRFWEKVSVGERSECWYWLGNPSHSFGYGVFMVNRKKHYPHRYSYFLHHGKYPEKQVNHKCDNPYCVNPYHLYEGTHKDNINDKVKRGRTGSKLKPEQVREIKADNTSTNAHLSRVYGVSATMIYYIKSGRQWGHI